MARTKTPENAAKHEPIDELIEEPPVTMTNLSSVDLLFLQEIDDFENM